jgi:hypothetical protein
MVSRLQNGVGDGSGVEYFKPSVSHACSVSSLVLSVSDAKLFVLHSNTEHKCVAYLFSLFHLGMYAGSAIAILMSLLQVRHTRDPIGNCRDDA